MSYLWDDEDERHILRKIGWKLADVETAIKRPTAADENTRHASVSLVEIQFTLRGIASVLITGIFGLFIIVVLLGLILWRVW